MELNNESKKGFVIFDMRVAGLLMYMKHRLKKVRPDREDIKKNVFIFDINETFESDLKYLKDNIKNIKI